MQHLLAALLIAALLLASPSASADAGPDRRVLAPIGGGLRGLLPPMSPGEQCRAAIRAAELAAGIPRQLMAAIGRVESGRPNGLGGVDPWPWSINAEGIDHVYETKAAALAGVAALQARGIRSIDVGCMQVNLMYHPDAFASVDQAFDPNANATYAAHFLAQLYAKTGSWPAATANYHSGTPELGAAYQRKVAAIWPEEQRRADAPTALASAGAGWPQPGWPATPGGIAPGAGGAFMLGNRAEAAHVIPLPGGGLSRGLEAYRAAPIPVAGRPIGRAPL